MRVIRSRLHTAPELLLPVHTQIQLYTPRWPPLSSRPVEARVAEERREPSIVRRVKGTQPRARRVEHGRRRRVAGGAALAAKRRRVRLGVVAARRGGAAGGAQREVEEAEHAPLLDLRRREGRRGR